MASPNKSYPNVKYPEHTDIDYLSGQLEAQSINAKAEEDPTGCWAPALCGPPKIRYPVEYPVAMSNSLFRDSEIGKDLPCQNCNLIDMGSMACYQEFCPECGKIPPNREIKVQHPTSMNEHTDIDYLSGQLQAQSIIVRAEEDSKGCWASGICGPPKMKVAYWTPAYPVAMSNSLFTDSQIGKDLPCQNCNLIDMGSMACYQEFCPECGKIPPNRDIKVEDPASRGSKMDKKTSKKGNTYFQKWAWKVKVKKCPKLDYQVAVSNRLFKDSEILKDLPCQYCNLIKMGSMACYTEFCPKCGNIPPNQHPIYSRKK